MQLASPVPRSGGESRALVGRRASVDLGAAGADLLPEGACVAGRVPLAPVSL